jgi:hypothetical protein
MIDVGSWLRADQSVDYGAHDVVKQEYAQNSLVDGGQFSYEHAAIRRMSFPLLVPSGGIVGQSLDTIEQLLGLYARPGGYIDIQPDGVPTAEMVRFDLLGGRVNHDPYSVQLQRIDRRFLRVDLDTQPYGYWPTTIILASQAAATAFPFSIAIPPGSIMGDAPGLAQIVFQPSSPTYYNAGAPSAQTWDFDGFWYSLERPGGQAFFTPSDFYVATTENNIATFGVFGLAVASDSSAPFGARARAWFGNGLNGGSGSVGRWAQAFVLASQMFDANNNVPTPYRGRFRVFAALRLTPSMGVPWQITADEAAGAQYFAQMASANPVATLIPQANPSWADSPTSAYQYVDLGEHSWPRSGGSGAADGFSFRIWAYAGPSGLPAVGTATLELGGIFLQRLGQAAGIAGRGWVVPSVFNVLATGVGAVLGVRSRGRTLIDSIAGRMSFVGNGANLATTTLMIGDARPVVSGQFPLIATALNLDIGVFHRRVDVAGATANTAIAGVPLVTASLAYRPRFKFLKGI